MARVTHVKRAQQRYETVPVIDPATGEQKQTPVMKRVWDEQAEEYVQKQKTTKRGKPVFMRVTVEDRSKPKDPYTCDYCHQPIEVGTPYKHVTPKSGPYGGRKRTRHEDCPTWKVWELSNSWSARIAQATDGFSIDDAETVEDVQSALDDVAEAIRELAEESRETASNIEDGFGHPTQQSEDAEQRADDLDGWADDIEQADIPELPEPEERYFITDTRTGARVGETEDGYESEDDAVSDRNSILEDYLNDGQEGIDEETFEIVEATPEEPTEEQMEQWRSDVEDAVAIVDESPV